MVMSRWLQLPLYLGPIIAFAALPAAAQVQPTQRLIVVSSDASVMYEEAVEGLRALTATTIDAATLGPDNSALSASITHAGHETAVVTLGNRAREFLAQLPATLPVVHCMVVGDAADTESALDVPLAIPINVESLWLRRLLPDAHVVAILYSPSLNEHVARAAVAELTALGFTAIAQPVAAPEGLPQALRNIAKADALLAIPDAEIYTPELARGLLLFTYRTNTPLVAYSQAWVRDGAFVWSRMAVQGTGDLLWRAGAHDPGIRQWRAAPAIAGAAGDREPADRSAAQTQLEGDGSFRCGKSQ